MKTTGFILIICCGLFACSSGDTKVGDQGMSREEKSKALKDSTNFTSISWLDSTFRKMGPLKSGEKVEVSFRFRNTGTKNLVITDVTAGCGCTIPEKPGKAYAPGEEGVIKATFNSNGFGEGEARKEIYVTANTMPSNAQTLAFSVEVTK